MRRLTLLCLPVLFLAGCLLPQTMSRTDLRINAIEQENRVLKGELEKLEQSGRQDRQSLRAELAALRADLNSLREELQQLRGEIEKAGHDIGQVSRRITDAEKERRENMYALTSGVLERLAAVEARLGLRDAQGAKEEGAQSKAHGTDIVAGAAVEGKPKEAEGKVSDKSLYEFARKAFEAGDYNAARKSFRELVSLFPKSDLCDNALFWIGESYFREKWYEKAILEYQKVIDGYPEGNKVPAALLKQGICFRAIGKDREAMLVFESLVKKFPGSPDSEAAQKQLSELGK